MRLHDSWEVYYRIMGTETERNQLVELPFYSCLHNYPLYEQSSHKDTVGFHILFVQTIPPSEISGNTQKNSSISLLS